QQRQEQGQQRQVKADMGGDGQRVGAREDRLQQVGGRHGENGQYDGADGADHQIRQSQPAGFGALAQNGQQRRNGAAQIGTGHQRYRQRRRHDASRSQQGHEQHDRQAR